MLPYRLSTPVWSWTFPPVSCLKLLGGNVFGHPTIQQTADTYVHADQAVSRDWIEQYEAVLKVGAAAEDLALNRYRIAGLVDVLSRRTCGARKGGSTTAEWDRLHRQLGQPVAPTTQGEPAEFRQARGDVESGTSPLGCTLEGFTTVTQQEPYTAPLGAGVVRSCGLQHART